MSDLLWALLVPDPWARRQTAVRDRLADGLAVLLALAYGGLMVGVGDATAPGAAVPWPVDVAIGVAAALTLLRRRRRPLRLALILLPLGAVSVMAGGAILAALFTVAARRRAALAVMLAAANVATGAIYFLLQDDPPYPLWVDLAMRATTGLAAIGWGQFVQAYRRLTGSLRAQASRLAAEQQLRIDQARLTERARIAREMHDVLAHRMALVSLHAGALEVRTDAQPEEIAVAAGAIRASAHEALQELRAVIGVLREGRGGRPEPPQPGLRDLPDLVDSSRATGMAIELRCLVEPEGPSVVLGRTAYRLVQEALTNAAKHAPGSAIEVLLDGEAGGDLRVRITNELTGTPDPTAPPGSGLGLVGVDERVALAGGRVVHGPAEGQFRLEAWLPWPDVAMRSPVIEVNHFPLPARARSGLGSWTP